jgi:hypothetical protein
LFVNPLIIFYQYLLSTSSVYFFDETQNFELIVKISLNRCHFCGSSVTHFGEKIIIKHTRTNISCQDGLNDGVFVFSTELTTCAHLQSNQVIVITKTLLASDPKNEETYPLPLNCVVSFS